MPTRRERDKADGTLRLSRRALCAGLVVAALAVPSLAAAQDAAGALRDLAESPDFRVRVSAALYLGRTKPPGAREALERGLSDGHPTVRVAVAAALGALGDPAAVGALTRRLSSESSASVAAQIHTAIDRLHKGVRGEDLRRVLHEAAVSRAHGLKGSAVVDGDSDMLAQAAQRHLPVITLDGSLTQVLESRVAGTVQVQARVEFAVRREQTLKGTLSGAATTFGSTPSLSDQSRRQLQNDAVDGAVQSALRGADQGLIVASL